MCMKTHQTSKDISNHKQNNMYDVIIIGGGPAGMNAALYLLRNNKKVLIIEKETFGGQIATSPRLENLPTIKEISGLEFSSLFFDQILARGADFELENIKHINKNGNTFTVSSDKHSFEGKSVIIANGLEHNKLGLPNEDKFLGKGVSYCAVCDGPFYKGQEAFLIGDANTALQYALLLSDYCPKVHLITLFDRFFGEKIMEERVRLNPKIEIQHNFKCIEFIGDDSLTGLRFINTKTNEEFQYETNNVFIAIGQSPNNGMFNGLVDMEKGFIVTNDLMETNIPGLFAAGDTRKKEAKQVITACNDGAIAALSAVNYLNTL